MSRSTSRHKGLWGGSGVSQVSSERSPEIADQALRALLEQRIASFAPNTQRALKADWRVWRAWCEGLEGGAQGRRIPFPLQAQTLVEFIYAHSPALKQSADGSWALDVTEQRPGIRSAKTLARYLSSLKTLQLLAGEPDTVFRDPDVQHALRTVQRCRKDLSASKAPIRLSEIEQLIAEPTRDLREARDKAMAAVAYFALLRRSELVALSTEDVQERPGGSALVHVRFSKTDQGAKGQVRYLPPQGLQLLKDWCGRAGITQGPLFRKILRNGWLLERPLRSQEVARIFKRLAPKMGLDPRNISGHSTRIGAAHDLVSAGFGLPAVMQAGGWKSSEMPAHYAKGLDAHQGAMAQLIRRRARRKPRPRPRS